MEIVLVVAVVIVFGAVVILTQFGPGAGAPGAAPARRATEKDPLEAEADEVAPAVAEVDPEPAESLESEPEIKPEPFIEPVPNPVAGYDLGSGPAPSAHTAIEHSPSARGNPFSMKPRTAPAEPAPAAPAASRGELEHLEKLVEMRDERIAELDARLEALKAAFSELDSKLGAAPARGEDDRISPLQKKVEDLAGKLAKDDPAVPELASKVHALETRLADLEDKPAAAAAGADPDAFSEAMKKIDSRLEMLETAAKKGGREKAAVAKLEQTVPDLEDRLARAEAAFVEGQKSATGRDELKEIFQRLSELEASLGSKGAEPDAEIEELKELFNNIVRNLDAQAERAGGR